MSLLFCGPMETHSSRTGIHLQCWLGHMQFAAGVDQSLGELTLYWLAAMQIMSVSLAFAIRASSFCRMIGVRRSSCPLPWGQIHLGRSCGCWWNLLLISIIKFSSCFCTNWIDVSTKSCLTPFIPLTSSLKLTWLQFSNFFTCIRRTQCPSYCAWQSVSVLWHILLMFLGDLVLIHGGCMRGMLSTFFCCASSLLLRDQACDFRSSDHASIFWVRQDLQSQQMLHHQPWRMRSLAQEPGK